MPQAKEVAIPVLTAVFLWQATAATMRRPPESDTYQPSPILLFLLAQNLSNMECTN